MKKSSGNERSKKASTILREVDKKELASISGGGGIKPPTAGCTGCGLVGAPGDPVFSVKA